MQQTLTRNDTLQAVRDEREWWDAMVADTGPDRMSSIRITEDWTLKDLIAHLLSWWEWRLTRLQASVNYEPKPEPPYPANLESIDEQNAWFHQQKLDRAAQDLTSAFSRSFDQLEQIVAGLSDDELADPNRVLFLGGKSLADSITNGHFFEHWHVQHADQIEAWLEANEDGETAKRRDGK
jgi:hypothetical protein